MSKLGQRVITAVILVALLLVVFLALPPAGALSVLAVFVLAGAWEWAGFVGATRPAERLVYVALVALVMAGTAWAIPSRAPAADLAWVSMVWWALAMVWILRFPVAISRASGAISGLLVLIPAWVAVSGLYGAADGGGLLVLSLLAIVWAADVGAYFTGRRIGRLKLAPQVSPGKTWEGVAGGLMAAAGVSWLVAILLGVEWVPMVSVGLAAAAISVVGDLTVSMFKRNAGLKDSGSLFPGHGGVLDRMDSIAAAAPLFLIAAGWQGLLA